MEDEEEYPIAGGKGRVLFPKGLRPKNPLKSGSSDEMKLAKKIVEKYSQRKDKLEETKKWVAKKTSLFATNLLDTAGIVAGLRNNNEEDVDPYVEQHLRQLLGRIGGPQPPVVPRENAIASGPSSPGNYSQHPLLTLCWHTLSTSPINTPYRHPLSTQPRTLHFPRSGFPSLLPSPNALFQFHYLLTLLTTLILLTPLLI